MNTSASISRVEAALIAIRAGLAVVVADSADRENEGDLIFAAEAATPELLAFTIRHTSGVVCVALPSGRLSALGLPLMVSENTESQRTAFTISVDLRHGTTTGISAADRAMTIRALADPGLLAGDLLRPGHVFPLQARDGGVLRRPGHTEAACDLARLAGRQPAGALCEIVNDDGTMLRGDALENFAREHGLPFLTVEDLVVWRRASERLVERAAEARMPTAHGEFRVVVYRSTLDGVEHVALVKGDVAGQKNVLVRVHSECFTGDILGSARCDCGRQLDMALGLIEQEGSGVVVYLRGHEGRGIGLTDKVHAYALQDNGRDTVEANRELGLPVDSRRYDVGAQILTALGLTTIRLMSNNPAKFTQLSGYDLQIVGRVPLVTTPNPENISYLRTKQEKLGHLLDLPTARATEVAA